MNRGTPSLAQAREGILSLPAAMMLGIFPGMSIPPAINSPINSKEIWLRDILGLTSAAVSVALSITAEIILSQ